MGCLIWSILSGCYGEMGYASRVLWTAKHAEGWGCRRWGPGRGTHLQFSTRYCTTLSSTFSISAVRTHMCFKACGLRPGAFPLAEPCLRRASWLPAEGFLQRVDGL